MLLSLISVVRSFFRYLFRSFEYVPAGANDLCDKYSNGEEKSHYVFDFSFVLHSDSLESSDECRNTFVNAICKNSELPDEFDRNFQTDYNIRMAYRRLDGLLSTRVRQISKEKQALESDPKRWLWY